MVFFWALPRRLRKMSVGVWKALHSETLARIIRRPATAWIAFCGSIAFWHLPKLYRVAVDDEGLHVLMHLSFFTAGLLFWSIVLEPSGKRRLDFGRTILFVFSTAMVTGIPGALLNFAHRVIYQGPNAAPAFGLTPLEDQRLAGLIMWIPMDLVLFGVAGALFVAWLSSADRRQLANVGAVGGTLLLLPILFLLSGCGESGNVEPRPDLDGNRSRGAALMIQYGCGSCHEVTGIRGAYGLVGPSLDRFGRRIYIAGMLRNSPDNLIRWLQNPQAIVPGNVMPNMHISKADARDIAAYLLTLE
jgi:putative membrane protein